MNFSLLYHQKIDFRIFDELLPWEREVYLTMLVKQVEEDNEKEKLLAQERKSKEKTRRARRR